jgi:poly-gamma-glutamate synthesis protein (capsule biosynthesis protein)
LLDAAGIVHAGVGRNLAEAREPAYLDTDKGRVALISMTSTFSRFKRAGEQRAEMKGRPGINPLRYYHVVNPENIERIKDIALNILGMECFQDDDTYYFVRPGIHNSVYKFVVNAELGIRRVAWKEDVAGNLRSIREARRQADLVLVQLHFHEWELGKGREVPAEFVPSFARACIDGGADAFIGQGAHILRGIEIYRDKPIFYEPQTFVSNGKVTRLPADYYLNVMYQKYAKVDLRSPNAMPCDALEARSAAPLEKLQKELPLEARCAVLGVCTFGADRKLSELKLYPCSQDKELPMLADRDSGKKIIEHLQSLSSPYGTIIKFEEGIGCVKIK